MAYSLRALSTRSVTFLAPSFFNRSARWKSTVRGLILSLRPASLLEAPRMICASVIRPLGVKVSSPGMGFDRTSSAPLSLLISCLARFSSGFPEISNCGFVSRWSIDLHAPHRANRRSSWHVANRCGARSCSARREIDRVRARSRRTPSNASLPSRTHFRSLSCRHGPAPGPP